MSTMQRFEHIAPYYEVFFPARPVQLNFLQRTLPPGVPPRWVDIACGTGQQMEALCDRGLEVWGLDLEPAMIKRLKRRRPDLADRVVIGDMRKADRHLRQRMAGPAGVVYCIGNSLVQLTRLEDIGQALSAFRALLASDGALAVQIVNFDRVLAGDFALFPKIERTLPNGRVCSLERRYAASEHEGCIRFETRLVTPGGIEERSHDLFALEKEKLAVLLNRAGFTRVQWFGDFQEHHWQADSPATIVRGTRR